MNKIVVAGSGTAGLISALMLKQAFPNKQIEVISSTDIGIIGVGEGSTEHWRIFMDICQIPLAEMIYETKATHKNGIRFENWTNHTPDYFHSISGFSQENKFNIYPLYAYLIENNKTLTENIASTALIENMVRADNPHTSVNQYHFDTFKLNKYLTNLCLNRGISMRDAHILHVNLNSENGSIESITIESGEKITADFWVDATGMKRLLISSLKSQNWKSFSNYLQMDSAIPFPTEPDPSGQIRPYTRARAIQNGWVWEIPTQERRGNGYVYSSRNCTDEQAIDEVSQLLGFEVQPVKTIKFDPGHIPEMWIKNCVAVGLASAFVEPIEATSIGGTIQQIRCLIDNVYAYEPGCVAIQKSFNYKMNIMMENILSMIYLHYISDREDTAMWREQKNMPAPEYLKNLLDIWSERLPAYNDIDYTNYEMFHVQHFYHVAQGQKVINQKSATRLLENFRLREDAKNMYYNAKLGQTNHAKVDHFESLKQIQI